MLSRWQEAAVNKKYEDEIRKNNAMSREVMRLEQELNTNHD
jgi:hypothetical protein